MYMYTVHVCGYSNLYMYMSLACVVNSSSYRPSGREQKSGENAMCRGDMHVRCHVHVHVHVQWTCTCKYICDSLCHVDFDAGLTYWMRYSMK